MNKIRMKTKVILSGEEDFFGPGMAHLLKAIDETGTIQKAAEKMNMSYSKCWKLINRAEKQTGIRFVERMNGGKYGGSSVLTDEGREFLEKYLKLTGLIRTVGEQLLEKYFPEEHNVR